MTDRIRATADGTRAFAEGSVSARGASPSSYRIACGLTVSSIGLGTYLGDADDAVDLLYTESVIEAVGLGCNVVDTAVNYRLQRSERAVGVALGRLVASGRLDRTGIVVSTKGGYVPFEGAPPATAGMLREFLTTEYFDRGICRPVDMASRGQHCMAPGYLDDQLRRSLANLGLDAVDIYYLHNPECQLPEVGRDEFERRIRAAFERLEQHVADGRIGVYGTATWNGYRTDDGDSALSLARLVALAREVGGADHHFRAIQLPYNIGMTEAFASFHQEHDGHARSVLEVAASLGVSVFASASLLQSRLVDGLPPEVIAALGRRTHAQCALEFVRSTPGITCALAGMARTAHVRENLELLTVPPAEGEAVAAMFVED